MADLTQLVKAKRGKTGLRKVAEEIGLSASTLSRIEAGDRTISIGTFDRLVRWLGVSADNVLNDTAPYEPTHRCAPPLAWVLSDVEAEVRRAVEIHGGYNSAHEAYGVLKEEVDEFWEEVRKKRSERDPERMREELIQVAACAVKAAMCLGARGSLEGGGQRG